ncbi:MAG: sulfotransferase domain-containing protein [Bacteroidales bacterium]|nr:sulfotransferase domain-containing protein [Bacteroidales bacterium]
MNNKKIIWLASYPKSGNTWFRVFLSNLLSAGDKPADINNLHNTPIASARQIFDEVTGLSSSELTSDEIENLRPEVYKQIAQETEEVIYKKIHDSYHLTQSGKQLIPTEYSKGVIYFVRNPLDVAISFAHHSNCSFSKMIKNMSNTNYSFCAKDDRLQNQLLQKLDTWSNHVISWLNQKNIPVHLMRYEDMKGDTFNSFKKATDFIGLNNSDEEIKKAIEYSSIKELQKQESNNGFKEKSPNSKSFFRKGEINSWKDVLTNNQIDEIINRNNEIMKRLDYLDSNNKLLL